MFVFRHTPVKNKKITNETQRTVHMLTVHRPFKLGETIIQALVIVMKLLHHIINVINNLIQKWLSGRSFEIEIPVL